MKFSWGLNRIETPTFLFANVFFLLLPTLYYIHIDKGYVSEIEQLKSVINSMQKNQNDFIKQSTEENSLYSAMLVELRNSMLEIRENRLRPDKVNTENKLKMKGIEGSKTAGTVRQNESAPDLLVSMNMFESKSINDSTISNERNLVQSNSSSLTFCDALPFLSPINSINNFQYDERVDRIMNQILAMSSKELLEDHHTPQYKTACWILFDDKLQMEPTNHLFIQRYVLSLIIFSNQNKKTTQLIPLEICDFSRFVCNSERQVTKIFLSEYDFQSSKRWEKSSNSSSSDILISKEGRVS